MPDPIIFDTEDFHRVEAALEGICRQARAESVLLVDRNGQLLVSSGTAENLDGTSLGSLAAGAVAATGGMAALLGEPEFTSIDHGGENRNLHISVLPTSYILLVLFDDRSSMGLVRLRVQQGQQALLQALTAAATRVEEESILDDGFFSEINEDDIDALFG